jgi:enoyl-CoA hydratase
MNYQNIQYESLGHVARISHARPHRRKAQNVELLDELDNGLRRAVADPEIPSSSLPARATTSAPATT